MTEIRLFRLFTRSSILFISELADFVFRYLCELCALCGDQVYLNDVRALRAMTMRCISEVPAEAMRISASR